jgi:N,N'-diacetyllegionaminate synthase
VRLIDQFRLPAIKIASPDLVNRPLLQHAAQLRKPLLISTGASTLQEIETTVGWLRDWNVQFALLHCISAYPTPNQDANLCWITELAARFQCPIGYSDHTTDLLAGPLAVAAGAQIIEKHLTYDRAAHGPDHSASFDPEQFRQYASLIRQADRLRGTPGRRVLPVEQDVRKVSRQSLVLRRALNPGDLLREDDLTIQRPGTGIPAADLPRVIGRKLTHPQPAGTLLTWDMLHAA